MQVLLYFLFFFFGSFCSCSWNFKLRRQSAWDSLRLFFPPQLCGSERHSRRHTNTPMHARVGQYRRKIFFPPISFSLKSIQTVSFPFSTINTYKLMQELQTASGESSSYSTYRPGSSPVFALSWCPNTQEPLCLARLDFGDRFLSLFLVRMLFPMLGKSPGAPTQGLSSGHPVALHQPLLLRRASNTSSRSSRHWKGKERS